MITACYVSHQCSRCGGEVIFDQKATGVQCRYCGAGMVVLGGRSAWLNFLIKPQIAVKDTAHEVTKIAQKSGWKPPLLRSVIPFYLPFYRITGQAIKWIKGEKRDEIYPHGRVVEDVKTRHFDLMRPAHTDLSAGLFSPGVRAQTLHLFLATRENAGGVPFLPIQEKKDSFRERVNHSTTEGMEAPGVKILEEKTFLIWERHSILYFPLSLVEVREGERIRLLLLDSVSGKLVRQIGHQEMENLLDNLGIGGSKSPGEGRLKLIPLVCPECAGDLDTSTTAVVRFCLRCGKGWESKGSRLRERECLWAGTEVMTRQEGVTFLPFWRRSTGEQSWLIPAFGVRSPHLLYNRSRRYYQARFPAETIPYNCRLRLKSLSAEIPPDEADEMMEVVAHTDNRETVQIKGTRQSLVLVPFRRSGPDLVDQYHGLAVPTGSLEAGL